MYIPTIGLEIHIETKTQTKMFCSCLNNPDETKPNTNVCPVCLAHPGSLPVINRAAIEAIVKLGFALGGTIDRYSHFDRKSYFYPDLPKGYQISQYEHPIVKGGILKDVPITRVHMEEDTGRLVHAISNPSRMISNKSRIVANEIYEARSTFENNSSSFEEHLRKSSLVDFNRAGVPLIELVTEPEVRDADHAVAFAKELQLIIRYLGISDGDMEKGQLRVEANISLSNPSRMISNKSRIMLKNDSYNLMGLLFEVHNKLGPIYKEKNYQDAIEEILKRENIVYQREKLIKLKFENLEVSDFFADFVVDNRIVLEVKAKPFITRDDFRQVSRYIKSLKIPLGIVVNFKRQKLEFKRIVNPAFENDSSLFEKNSRNVLGTKVEVKNLNSFKAVHDAIEYEIKRQKEVLESGGKVVQETRGWNDVKRITQSQRLKESAHDYRYFPEPDLPPLDMGKFGLEELRAQIPELPEVKRIRFAEEFKISKEQIEMLVNEKEKADYFEETATELKLQIANCKFQILANYFLTDLYGLMTEHNVNMKDLKISPHEFAHFVSFIKKGTLSSKLAKVLLEKMFITGEDPETLIEQGDLKLSTDERSIGEVIERMIKENPKTIADYKKGKQNALQFLIGKVMAETKGKAEPKLTQKLLKEKLEKI